MQSTALLDLIVDALQDAEEETAPVPPLAEAFARVPDPRRRQGRRYPLPFLLCALILAMLCNCDTLEAVGQWCAEHRALLAAHFPDQRFHTPTGSLYRRLLPRLSVVHVEAALTLWVRGSLVAAADDAVALDGKTVRGAGTVEQAAPHLLSASTHASGETLLQVRVAAKTNEIPIAREVLPTLPLAGRVTPAPPPRRPSWRRRPTICAWSRPTSPPSTPSAPPTSPTPRRVSAGRRRATGGADAPRPAPSTSRRG
jgi:hypothetical protein